MTTVFTAINTDRISFYKFKEHTLVKYNGNPMFVQSPWLNISCYGVPRRDKYHTSDDQRLYIKLPVSRGERFATALGDLDEFMQREDVKQQLLGEKYQKYDYCPLLKEPVDATDASRPPSVKLKLDVAHDSATIATEVYRVTSEGRELLKDIKTIDDFYNAAPYRSDVRVIFKLVKVWSQPPNLKNPTYGVTVKVMKMEVNQATRGGGNDCGFVDESDGVESEEVGSNY